MSDNSGQSHVARNTLLTRLVLVHLGVFIVFSSWAFGGQAPWARQLIAWWGTLGITLFIFTVRAYRSSDRRVHPALRLLWPLWLYDALAIASCFNPGFREIANHGELTLVLADPIPWLPTAALPRLTARELWQFNGLVISAFNLLLIAQRRGQIRALLLVLAGNAVVLAVFGTFQKLVGATGLWFDLVRSPNKHFFATFIYHNHWGAFTLLNTAVCLGLLFYYQRRTGPRDIWHSPVLMGVLITLLLALSIPLSTSRSCTVLAAVLLLAALAHLLLRTVRRRRERRESAALPVAAIIFASALAVAGGAFLARKVITERSQLTTQQLGQLAQEGTLTSRLILYRDTWHMAQAKPWFGWGLESYAHTFRIFNTQRAVETWVWIPFYAEAHNDWLQSLAEVGFVGTTLLALLLLLPLLTVPWRRAPSILPRYLLGGCLLILLYAWLEFPFANPAVMLTFATVFYGAVRYAQLDASHSASDA